MKRRQNRSDGQTGVKRLGILAMQGAFVEHIGILHQLGVEAIPVRLPCDLEGLDGLIIPGGESTSISRLMGMYDLIDAVRTLAAEGFPIYGTCAGMILLAKEAVGLEESSVAAMDIRVRRNAFGRQVDSFETLLKVPALGPSPFPAIFIRAPLIERVGPRVEVLARIPDGPVVAARQDNLLVSAFHPELTSDLRFHRYFLDLVGNWQQATNSKGLLSGVGR